jgi:phage gpG-like protein
MSRLDWSDLALRLERAERGVRPALGRAARRIAQLAERRAKEAVSGRVLNVRSGALRRSIRGRHEVDGRGARVTLQAGSETVKYAHIHEYGGIIRGRPWLVFQLQPGVWRKTQQVTIPSRPYMRPAIAEASRQANAYIAEEVYSLLQGG